MRADRCELEHRGDGLSLAKPVELIRLSAQHGIEIEALMHEALADCDPAGGEAAIDRLNQRNGRATITRGVAL